MRNFLALTILIALFVCAVGFYASSIVVDAELSRPAPPLSLADVLKGVDGPDERCSVIACNLP
jgi:hypothetical protein